MADTKYKQQDIKTWKPGVFAVHKITKHFTYNIIESSVSHGKSQYNNNIAKQKEPLDPPDPTPCLKINKWRCKWLC